MIDTSMLAAGSLIALVAGCWSNFKTFIGYASSFIVLNAEFDTMAGHAVRMYLKKNYSVVPSGQLHFLTRLYWKGSQSHRVPFRVLHSRTVFYRGFQVLLFRRVNGSVSILALRGTVDFQALLAAALVDLESFERQESAKQSNFYLNKIVGSEKGWGAGEGNSRRRQSGSRDDGDAESPITESSGGCIELDPHIDTSFMYKRETYSGDVDDNPFEHLYYGPEVEKYIEQALMWMTMRKWYEERSIPWRRGWLLYGPGGTGKSSMAKALAMKMRIPLYQYQLATLSDQEFIREWDNMATPSVVLFEDFDTVFNKRVPLTEHKLLTFDTVLNQISGVSTTNGLFLIVTTNHLDYIDEALGVECGMNGVSTRPGRIDSVIHLGYLNRPNRMKMANQVLKDWPDAIDSVVNQEGGLTPIQFQEICVQEAFRRINLQQVRELKVQNVRYIGESNHVHAR